MQKEPLKIDPGYMHDTALFAMCILYDCAFALALMVYGGVTGQWWISLLGVTAGAHGLVLVRVAEPRWRRFRGGWNLDRDE